MSYPEFADALALAGMAAFGCPGLAAAHSTPASRIEAFFAAMGLQRIKAAPRAPAKSNAPKAPNAHWWALRDAVAAEHRKGGGCCF